MGLSLRGRHSHMDGCVLVSGPWGEALGLGAYLCEVEGRPVWAHILVSRVPFHRSHWF